MIRILWDNETHEHLIVERDGEGTETLVFATPTFHEEAIRARLARADNLRSDPFEELEKYNAEVERRHDYELSEVIGDAGERLAYAFAQDGLTVRPRMTPLSMTLKNRKSLRNFEAPTRTIGNR